jgi:hypothetical protein
MNNERVSLLSRVLPGAFLAAALQGCAYEPVYAERPFTEKVGSAFIKVVIPTNARLERMARKQALLLDKGF